MPPEIFAWVGEYVEQNYRPEPKKRIKPRSFVHPKDRVADGRGQGRLPLALVAAEAGAGARRSRLPRGQQDAAAPPALPPVEKLTPESDFAPFMHPKVDDALRRVALKKLFARPAFQHARSVRGVLGRLDRRRADPAGDAGDAEPGAHAAVPTREEEQKQQDAEAQAAARGKAKGRAMSLEGKTLKVCSCNKTVAIDAKALAAALKRGRAARRCTTELCRKDAAAFQAALGDSETSIVACTQEAPLFARARRGAGRTAKLRFVNMREHGRLVGRARKATAEDRRAARGGGAARARAGAGGRVQVRRRSC